MYFWDWIDNSVFRSLIHCVLFKTCSIERCIMLFTDKLQCYDVCHLKNECYNYPIIFIFKTVLKDIHY